MTILKDRIVLYLPSKDSRHNDLSKDLQMRAFQEIIEPFAAQAGRATGTAGAGAFYDDKGKCHVEDVQLYTIFGDVEKLGGLDKLKDLAQALKDLLFQESVAFELNGQLYLI